MANTSYIVVAAGLENVLAKSAFTQDLTRSWWHYVVQVCHAGEKNQRP